MIQGFGTREQTDEPVRLLVQSAGGIMHEKLRTVGQYEKTEWPSFSGSVDDKPCVVFGILRGTQDIINACKANQQDWYYFDHAYFGGNKHAPSTITGEKIYRLTKNGLHIDHIQKLKKSDYERIEKYQKHITIETWKYNDDGQVLLVAPSEHAEKQWNMKGWTDNMVKRLKKQLKGRTLKIRKKNDPIDIKEDIKKSYCVVSMQSAVVFDCMVLGVPSFCEEFSMGAPVSNTEFDLDNPLYTIERNLWIDTLLANQFTMTELQNGTAWKYVSNS